MATKINSVDLGPIWLQSGEGVPDHLGIQGTIFVDLVNTNQYINKDGQAYWDRFLTSTSGGTDTFITGMTFSNVNYDLKLTRNDGVSFTQNLGILATDMTVTGGTYDINTGVVTFTNNTGGTFNVTGFTSGMTDSYTTGATLSGNVINFGNNILGPNYYNVDLLPLLSGKTNIVDFNSHTGNTNNPHQTSFSGLTSTAHTHSISDISGLTTSLNDKYDISGGTISGNTNILGGLTANTISATTYLNLPLDIRVTGGTYSSGTTTFTNNTGGTFSVSGFSTGSTLQSAYNASLTPEILTDGTRGPLSLRNGAGTTDATTKLFEGLGSGGTISSFINADGSSYFSGRTLLGTATDDGVSMLQSKSVTNTNASKGLSVFNFSNNPKFEVYGNNHIDIFRDANTDLSNQDGIFIHGAASSAGSNVPNRGVITFLNWSSTGVSGIQSASINYGNVRAGVHFLNGNSIRFGATVGGTPFKNTMFIGANLSSTDSYVAIGTETRINAIFNVASIVSGSAPFPRMTEAQRLATSVLEGLYVYQTDGVVGLYQYTSGAWRFNIVSTGTTTQFIKGDGSLDSNTYFNVTGGTISGNTNILGGLTANTISATTYQNLPLDVYTTGTTRIDDTVYFNRNNGLSAYTSNVGLSAENSRLLINDSSTGVISFSGFSFSPSGTTFNVGAIKAWFIDNETDPFVPTKLYTEFSATSGNVLTNLSGQNVTYIGVNSGGTIMQQSTPYHSNQTRTIIPLGVIVHSNRVFINAVNNQPNVSINPANQVSDLITNLGVFNIEGNDFNINGNNLNINKSQGGIFKQGVNFVTNSKDPHTLTLPALVAPSTMRYRLQTSVEYGNTAVIDPNNYDNNGVLTSVPDTKYTVQSIYLFQSNLVRIQYGQRYYDSLDDAKASIIGDPYIVEPNLLENGLLRCFLVVRKGTTDLTNTNQVKFIEASRFGTAIDTNTGSGLFRKQTLNNSSTGLISGGTLSTATTTTFNISAGSGLIVDNTTNPNLPVLTEVFWSAMTGITVTGLTGQSGSAIFINGSSNVVQLDGTTLPNASDMRDKIQLGLVAHPTGVVSGVYNVPVPIINPVSQINDLTGAMGPFSIAGNRIAKITGTLKITKSSGKSFFANSNYSNNRTTPSIVATTNLSGATFNYAKQNGFLGPLSSNIDVENYDNNGTITLLSNNDFAAHRIWHQPSNNILFFQYGQAAYSSLNDARARFQSENFIVPPPLDFGAYLVAVIIAREGITNLDNASTSEIIPQGKFAGTGGGGGGAVDTLQSVYNNSVTPEIVTDSTRGALSIKNGSGSADTVTNLFEGLNSGSTITSLIRADGTMKLSSSIQVGDDTNTASASNVGSIRYRTSGNNSYADMSMQTSATGYTWVNIVQNNW